MPAAVSYPGVYVVEESSGSRAIAGVATSIAAFVGMAEQGRMLTPIKLQSMAQFEAEFGVTTSGELADQVRQFYVNGGGAAYVCRIAHNAQPAQVTLNAETGGKSVLEVTARDSGMLGNMLRVEIDYDTASPERTFNFTVYRRIVKANGDRVADKTERYAGVSMDPLAASFIEDAINGISGLVTVKVLANAGAAGAVSIAGLVLPKLDPAVTGALGLIVTATVRSLRVSVAGKPPITAAVMAALDCPGVTPGAPKPDEIATQWTKDINAALASNGIADTVVVEVSGPTAAGGGLKDFRLLSISSSSGRLAILPAQSGDIAAPLGFGTAGGIEGDGYGDIRPAPTGLVARVGTSANRFRVLRELFGNTRASLTGFKLIDDSPNSPHGTGIPVALAGAGSMAEVGGKQSLANGREALDELAAQIEANTSGRWSIKRTGNRLALQPRYGGDNTGTAGVLTTVGVKLEDTIFDPALKPQNVVSYTVGKPSGIAGGGTFQNTIVSVEGNDGTGPLAKDYADAFAVINTDVDLFNLMVLPRADGQPDTERQALWGVASAFCALKRAMLIVDPPANWTTIAAATTGVDALRIGIETRNAAAYWPRLRIADGTPTGKVIDPAGSVAGLYARVDGNRGIWKAPAGLEATVRGVSGLERRITDLDNGDINPKALNALRVFPSGVVAWGARTLVGFNDSGNIDDKYVPVRRTMLYIEESLYRGLHFAVFEPNDEPLWAQIRLAAGSFMNGMFRQGAFAGRKTSDAYFVACDSTTTTATDINLGIVNVIVGFAPLKPAEFVVLTVKQIAGQVQI